MKRNFKNSLPHSVRMQHGYPNSQMKASKNHVGVKNGVKQKEFIM